MTRPLEHQPRTHEQARQMQQQHPHHNPKPTPAHMVAAPAKPTRKLGRKPRAFGNLPHFSAARMRHGVAVTPLPPSVHWTKGMPDDLGFMLNDKLGDCPIAGAHHGRQVWSFNGSGVEITDPDSDVLADYERFCGYDPKQTAADGSNPTDEGGVLQTVVTDGLKIGFTTATGPDKLVGFYEVDPRNLHDIGRVIAEAGFAYIGISIPEAWSQANAGDTWDATDSPIEGGHCVILTGYELGPDGLPAIFSVCSWGMSFLMTAAGFAQNCDEAYALVDRCFAEKTGLTPGGLTLAQIESDMQSIRGD